MSYVQSYSLDLNITSDCNWRCKYCIEKDHHCTNYMTKEVAEKIIEKIDYFLESNYCDTIGLGLWGGEPTLNYDIISLFVNYYYKNQRVNFGIFTNGSLLRKYYDLIDKINIYSNSSNDVYVYKRFGIQISYDGFPIHERKRRTIGNQPTALQTRELIKEVCEKKYSINLKSTFSYDDVDDIYESYLDILNLYKEINNNKEGIVYTPTMDYSNIFKEHLNDKNIYINFKTKLLEQIEKICITEYEELIKGNIKQPLFTWLDLSGTRNLFCSAGNNYHTCDYNGELLTCHGCLYIENNKEHKFASVFDDNEIFAEKVKNYSKNFEIHDKIVNKKYDCNNCSSILCYKCNAECYNISKEKNHIDKWYDFGDNITCDLFKEISYLIIAWKKIIMDKLQLLSIPYIIKD
jgi:organic radical activating enzyme